MDQSVKILQEALKVWFSYEKKVLREKHFEVLGTVLKSSEVDEALAHEMGYKDWNTLKAKMNVMASSPEKEIQTFVDQIHSAIYRYAESISFERNGNQWAGHLLDKEIEHFTSLSGNLYSDGHWTMFQFRLAETRNIDRIPFGDAFIKWIDENAPPEEDYYEMTKGGRNFPTAWDTFVLDAFDLCNPKHFFPLVVFSVANNAPLPYILCMDLNFKSEQKRKKQNSLKAALQENPKYN